LSNSTAIGTDIMPPAHVAITQALVTAGPNAIVAAANRNVNSISADNNAGDSKYPQPNTADLRNNCAIVSTARLLPDPNRNNLAYTTKDFLQKITDLGLANKFQKLPQTGLDGWKSDAECKALCDAFKTQNPTYHSIKPTSLSLLLGYLRKNQLQLPPPKHGFAICFPVGGSDHVVNGWWSGNSDRPEEFRFTDWQSKQNGEDVSEDVRKRAINGIWWFEKNV
jgi:hypothetical protein